MIILSIIDINPGMAVWSAIAFILLLVVLGKYAWKPILKSVHDRENSIADALETADKVRKEMADNKAENERMIQEAREEKAAMLKEAKEMKDKIVADAESEARAKAQKIVADAQVQIENQKMAAMMDVKNQVGALVMEVSEKVLRKEMGQSGIQKTYIDELTNEIKLN